MEHDGKLARSDPQANMEKPLPCFKGYSPRSLLSLLDLRFDTGYPVGTLTTRVEEKTELIWRAALVRNFRCVCLVSRL